MVDSAGEALAYQLSTSYYPLCWELIGMLTLGGAVESAGMGSSEPVPAPIVTSAPVATSAPVGTVPATPAPVATSAPVTSAPVPTSSNDPPENCRYCCSLGGSGCPAWDNGCFTEDRCGKTADCVWQSQEWVLECDDVVVDDPDDGVDDAGCCAQNGVCPTWTHSCFEYGKCGVDDGSKGVWCSWGGALEWVGAAPN